MRYATNVPPERNGCEERATPSLYRACRAVALKDDIFLTRLIFAPAS